MLLHCCPERGARHLPSFRSPVLAPSRAAGVPEGLRCPCLGTLRLREAGGSGLRAGRGSRACGCRQGATGALAQACHPKDALQ